MTKPRVAAFALFSDSSFGLPWSFGIRHSSFSVDISRPNEPSDYCAASALRARIRAHGAGDPDAAAKKRRLGCGIWRRGDGKYLRRADD